MSFFMRIVQFFVNDALVKGLAKSKTFQQFALKTDTLRQNMVNGKIMQESTKEFTQQMKAAAAANKTKENGFSFAQFWIEFTEEIGIGEDDGKGKEKSSVKKKSIPAGNKTKI